MHAGTVVMVVIRVFLLFRAAVRDRDPIVSLCEELLVACCDYYRDNRVNDACIIYPGPFP
jgi:hypothetical protein